MEKKKRLDLLLWERGLVESRSLAQRLVMAGKVRIDNEVALKSSQNVAEDAKLTIESEPKYVSRGGEKLEPVFSVFDLGDMHEKTCVDVGSSTGGFTDCLLQQGARKVFAVDVGYGLLHWKLRNHPAVVVMERTNARSIQSFPEKIDLVTIDASFIALRVLLPVIKDWFLTNSGQVVALVKPQFEADRKEAARGKGVIRDEEIHHRILLEVLNFAVENGFECRGAIRSPLLGPKGNVEFLIHLVFPQQNVTPVANIVDALFDLKN